MRAALWLPSAGLLLALHLPATAHAVEIPKLTARVMDRADLLSREQRSALEQRLRRFQEEKGTQVVVHTTPSLEGLDIASYSIQIAEAWKIGRKGLDDGVILTVAPNERKVRIEVGYALEGAIPDAIASRIQSEDILPSFRTGRFAEGIERGVDSILRAAAGEKLPEPARSPPGRGFSIGYLGLLLLLFLFTRILGLSGRSSRYRGHGGFGGALGGLGGHRGGGGGFSGGGGRFGGGGASGSW